MAASALGEAFDAAMKALKDQGPRPKRMTKDFESASALMTFLKALPVERQPEARIIGWGDPEMMKTNFHGWRLAYRVETEKP